jgi:hypothetical protein
MDVHLGFKGTNSNGHGEEIDKDMGMKKIIKKLQKEVQIHRADNKKLMTAKEQQGYFNVSLMHRLERIENKLDKESGSRKLGSRRSPDEKIRTRSVSIHHCHSPRHSIKRAHNNSSPSSIKKHKRSGVDDL